MNVQGYCPNHLQINKVGTRMITSGNAFPVPITFPFSGKPAAGAIINVPMVTPNFIGPNLSATLVYSGTLATANAVFTVNRISGGVTTEIGTITITNASNTSCTLTGTGAQFGTGDVLQLVAPATQDVTLANVGITIYTVREG